LRNDGVDIYKTKDKQYYVGKTESGEWLQYTINAKDSRKLYFDINYASNTAAKTGLKKLPENNWQSFH
jgi:hypothetical protein